MDALTDDMEGTSINERSRKPSSSKMCIEDIRHENSGHRSGDT